MNVIIPVAGEGLRLKPHTNVLPKCLLYVAGNTILGHILDSLKPLKIRRVIIVMGAKADAIVRFCAPYPLPFRFVCQPQRLGLGHAVFTGARGLKGPTLLILGDTIVDQDLRSFTRRRNNLLAVKKVSHPQRYGIIETRRGRIISVVEKPAHPKSDWALIGLYFFQKIETVYAAMKYIIKKNIRTKGEFQLTDGIKHLIDERECFYPVAVENWFDCGTPDALLETNRHLLKKKHTHTRRPGAVIRPPVYIPRTCRIENSIIGPDVSIAEDVVIRDSIITDSIINRGALVEKSTITGSIVGSDSIVRGSLKKIDVGDHSRIELP